MRASMLHLRIRLGLKYTFLAIALFALFHQTGIEGWDSWSFRALFLALILERGIDIIDILPKRSKGEITD